MTPALLRVEEACNAAVENCSDSWTEQYSGGCRKIRNFGADRGRLVVIQVHWRSDYSIVKLEGSLAAGVCLVQTQTSGRIVKGSANAEVSGECIDPALNSLGTCRLESHSTVLLFGEMQTPELRLDEQSKVRKWKWIVVRTGDGH